MDLELTGKFALVTGGSKGIGRAVAEALAAEGCNLALAARNLDLLDQAADEIRARYQIAVATIAVDLARSEDQQRLVDRFGDIDILVNNAGANPGGEIDEVSEEAWRSAWDLKVYAYINLTRSFYATMKTRRRGVIVNVIGNAGEQMNSRYIVGSAGNIALMGLTRALGARAPDFGIRVVGVNPGLTATDRAVVMLRRWSENKYGTPDRWQEFLDQMNLPFGRMGESAEVANAVAFLASPKASYISGTILTVDGGAAYRQH